MRAASSWVRPWAPAPQMVMTLESWRDRSFMAVPPEAPVRLALTAVPSAKQRGSLVSGSLRTIMTLARGRPCL